MRMLNEATENAASAIAFVDKLTAGDRARRAVSAAVPAAVVAEIADWNADVERRKAEKRMRQLRDRMLAAEQR